MRSRIVLLFVFLVFLSAYAGTVVDYSCVSLPGTPYNYANIAFPSDIVNNLSSMDNMPATNPTSDAGATLGRVLFYDKDLSLNRTISCSSCHLQKFSFTDTARFSRGFNGQLTGRNSMGLIHARFQRDGQFFWDNRAATLEAQTLIPFQSAVEMGLTLDTLVGRVAAKPLYAPLFQNAFGSTTVNSDRIAKAIAQFIRSMNTFGSKFRQGVEITNGSPETTPFSNFTAQENLGKNLFMDITRGNCQACHTRNVMVQQGAQNIGLDSIYSDNGVGAATNNHRKDGWFSVPSLINVEFTPPYMHDGRFQTLEQVIDFYSDSVHEHANLSGFLREIIPGTVNPNNNTCDTCPPRRPHYTPTEKAALVAFLKTLTDTVITTDVRWSNPFCKFTTGGTINLTVYFQGYYTGSSSMTPAMKNRGIASATVNQADTVFIELRDSANADLVKDTATAIVLTNGSATVTFTQARQGVSYWIVVKHRRSVETWSASTVAFGANVTYDFSASASMAYGSNQFQVGPGKWAVYTGDVAGGSSAPPDGSIDLSDLSAVEQALRLFLTGNVLQDVNGDGIVESDDYLLIENNYWLGVHALRP